MTTTNDAAERHAPTPTRNRPPGGKPERCRYCAREIYSADYGNGVVWFHRQAEKVTR